LGSSILVFIVLIAGIGLEIRRKAKEQVA